MTEAMRRRTAELGETAEHAAATTARAGDAVQARAAALKSATRQVNADLEAIGRQLAQSAQSVHGLERATEQVSGKVSYMAGSAGTALTGAAAAANSFREHAEALAASGERILEMVQRADKTFRQHGEGMTTTAAAALRSANEVEKSLRRQIAELAATGAKMSKTTGETEALFREQTEKLIATSERAVSRADEIRRADEARRGEEIIRAAAFAIERLDSIAVDLSRLLDRRIADSVWERYYRGEKGLFTKRLLGRRDTAKIRKKYRDDGDFRRYVDLYHQEFDGLMTQARKTEHGGLLRRALLTSDVGKLYVLLSQALEQPHITE